MSRISSFSHSEPILIPSPQDAITDIADYSISTKTLQLNCTPDKRFTAHILVAKEGGIFLEEAEVDTKFTVPGNLFEKLRTMAQQRRQAWFFDTFFVHIKRFPDGQFKVTLSPKLLGGGGCSSKATDDVCDMFYKEMDKAADVTRAPVSAPSFSGSSVNTEELPFIQLPAIDRLEQVRNNHELATFMRTLHVGTAEYSAAEAFASQMIIAYATTKNKTPAHHREIMALGQTNNPIITRSLLKVLIKEFQQGDLLDWELIKVLNLTLKQGRIAALDDDELLELESITNEKLNTLRQTRSEIGTI